MKKEIIYKNIKARKKSLILIICIYFIYSWIVNSTGRFDWGYWLYKGFAPNHYIVFDEDKKCIISVSKDGREEKLLNLPDTLDISNAIQIDEKSIFVINTSKGAELCVYNAETNTIMKKAVLAQMYYKTWERIYLLNNNLYIKVFYPKKIIGKNLLPGAGESSFAYFTISLNDLLKNTHNTPYNPISISRTQNSYEGLTLKFEQGIFKENSLEDKNIPIDSVLKRKFIMNSPVEIYKEGTLNVEYKNTDVLKQLSGWKAMGEYTINNKTVDSTKTDINEFLRFNGVFNNKYILFDRWFMDGSFNDPEYYASVSPVLYILDNKLFNKVYLPDFLWKHRGIIYIR